MGKADLHIHTTASDGSCEPDEVIRLAASKRLNVVSITDHDTIEGYRKAVGSAKEESVKLIPGVELTTQREGRQIHLLAYDFDPADRQLAALLKRQRRARLERMESILDLLRRKQGIDLTLDEVKAQARSSNVGRPHLAKLLIRKKWVATMAEAFIRYLGTAEVTSIETGYAGLEETVQVIIAAGGVTSLAHPGPLYSMEEIRNLLAAGLDGIECIHPAHGFDKQKVFVTLAEEKRLLVTGGSDFHGTGKEYAPWFGVLTLGEKRVAALERMAQNRKVLNPGMNV